MNHFSVEVIALPFKR